MIFIISWRGGEQMRGLKMFISALLAGVMVGGTSFIAVVQNSKVELVRLSDIDQITWAIIAVGAILVTAQNVQTYLKRPPEGGKFFKPNDD